MCPVIFADQKRAGRIHIDSVNDPRSEYSVDSGKIFPAVKHDRVDQRAAVMSRCRMYDHSFRLVYDKDIRILIENVKGEVFRNDLRQCLRLRDLCLYGFVGSHFIIRFDGISIDGDITVFDKFLNMGAGKIRQE
ncbi:unknown [Lachnospiraceae bacterium CAG:215]|nr:unknown [Lachnospiraceae bacterium CAG:215]